MGGCVKREYNCDAHAESKNYERILSEFVRPLVREYRTHYLVSLRFLFRS